MQFRGIGLATGLAVAATAGAVQSPAGWWIWPLWSVAGMASMAALGLLVWPLLKTLWPIVVDKLARAAKPPAAIPETPEYTPEASIRSDGSVRLRLINRDPKSEPVGWICEVQDPRFPAVWFHPYEVMEEGDYRVRLEVVYPDLFEDAPNLPLAPGWYMARWKQASFGASSGKFQGYTRHLATQRFEIGVDGQIVGQAAPSGWVLTQREFSAEMGGPGIMLTIESQDDEVGVVRCTVVDPARNAATADNTSIMVPSQSVLPKSTHQFLYPSSDFTAKPSGTLVDGDYSVAWFDISGAGEVSLGEGHFTMRDGHLV